MSGKVTWIEARAGYISAPPVTDADEGQKKLLGVFGPLYNDIIEKAMINLTALIGSPISGSCDSNGTYDGMIGDLQKNKTDFTILATAHELISPHHPVPATFNFILREDGSFFVSSPLTNVTKQVKGLHESFYVFDIYCHIMFLTIFFLSLHVLYHKTRYQKKPKTTWDEPLPVTSFGWFNKCFWTFVSLALKQNLNYTEFLSSWAIVSLTSFSFFMLTIYILLSVAMNTDLVKYSDVRFLNTVQDVIDSGVPLKFTESAATYSILKLASKGSEMARALESAMEAAGFDERKMIYSSTDIFGTGENVIDQKMITIIHGLPMKLLENLQCMKFLIDSQSKLTEKKYSESRLYRSNEYLYTQHDVIFYSNYASDELKSRVRESFLKAIEGGLSDLINDIAPDRLLDILFGENQSVATCMNTKYWVQKGQHVQDVSFENISKLFRNLIFMGLFSFLILIVEIVIKNIWKSKSTQITKIRNFTLV